MLKPSNSHDEHDENLVKTQQLTLLGEKTKN